MSIDTGAGDYLRERQLAGLRRGRGASYVNIAIALAVMVAVNDARLSMPLVGWFVALSTVVVGRTVVTVVARRRGVSPRGQLCTHAAGATANGMAWVALPVILLDSANGMELAFAGFVIAGMTAGALSTLCWYRPAYLGYTLTATVTLAGVYVSQAETLYVVMGICTLLYAAILVSASATFAQQINELLRLKDDLEVERARLAAAREDLVFADRTKWRTLAHLSHVLRTPMNAVIGFSDILQSERFGTLGSPQYKQYASHIHSSGIRALRTIDDILDASDAEAGTLVLSVARIDPLTVVRDCVARHREAANRAGVAVEERLPAALPSIDGDALRVRQMIDSLLDNAIRYALPGGRVSVSARRDGADWVEISIADTGRGIPSDRIVDAVRPFVRLDDPMTQGHECVGVGLSLTRRLVELHGGRFELQSPGAGGTVATLRLPVPEVEAPDGHPGDHAIPDARYTADPAGSGRDSAVEPPPAGQAFASA